jgi:hypothetical protein
VRLFILAALRIVVTAFLVLLAASSFERSGVTFLALGAFLTLVALASLALVVIAVAAAIDHLQVKGHSWPLAQASRQSTDCKKHSTGTIVQMAGEDKTELIVTVNEETLGRLRAFAETINISEAEAASRLVTIAASVQEIMVKKAALGPHEANVERWLLTATPIPGGGRAWDMHRADDRDAQGPSRS